MGQVASYAGSVSQAFAVMSRTSRNGLFAFMGYRNTTADSVRVAGFANTARISGIAQSDVQAQNFANMGEEMTLAANAAEIGSVHTGR